MNTVTIFINRVTLKTHSLIMSYSLRLILCLMPNSSQDDAWMIKRKWLCITLVTKSFCVTRPEAKEIPNVIDNIVDYLIKWQ